MVLFLTGINVSPVFNQSAKELKDELIDYYKIALKLQAGRTIKGKLCPKHKPTDLCAPAPSTNIM